MFHTRFKSSVPLLVLKPDISSGMKGQSKLNKDQDEAKNSVRVLKSYS